MGDGDHGLAFHQPQQLVLDASLDLAVERRRGLIEHQDRRVLEDHPRDRDALPLPARELDPALAHMRVVAGARLQSCKSTMKSCACALARGRLDRRMRRLRPAVADVVAIERCSSEVSCVTMPICGAQAFLCDRAMSWPSMRMRPCSVS